GYSSYPGRTRWYAGKLVGCKAAGSAATTLAGLAWNSSGRIPGRLYRCAINSYQCTAVVAQQGSGRGLHLFSHLYQFGVDLTRVTTRRFAGPRVAKAGAAGMDGLAGRDGEFIGVSAWGRSCCPPIGGNRAEGAWPHLLELCLWW